MYMIPTYRTYHVYGKASVSWMNLSTGLEGFRHFIYNLQFNSLTNKKLHGTLAFWSRLNVLQTFL